MSNTTTKVKNQKRKPIFQKVRRTRIFCITVCGNRHEGNPCDITEVNCSAVVKKVRTLIVMFKRSPINNDVLQKYVTAEFGKQLTPMSLSFVNAGTYLFIKKLYTKGTNRHRFT